ncbi:MAG: DEAD/DEAH box helicase [Fusobacterium perfoetens]|uniref:DEAD/DEAH box helicase n=1 Tax=Fusobacterium perfoetens TaxID=852 RepID=UPI0023F0856E|nr:DEAD/DEAH box helicase [Fusobacterium perfoetens]MCI6152579.1 DEAD/DEAH box helicase [Fusobacterium perfoetens]MDY3237587.1 DEAD/DEAH box helicase [Fusobacterium perfoetens]
MDNLIDEKNIYFMLCSDENGGFIRAIDNQKNKITDFSNYNIKNEHIQNIITILEDVEQDDFFSGWGDEPNNKELYLEDAAEVINNLKNIDTFVDENFNKILWSFEENTLTLKIEEVENNDLILKSQLLLNKKYTDFKVISENLIFRKGIIYVFDNFIDDIHFIQEMNTEIPKDSVEAYLSLANHYIKDLEILYNNYTTEEKKDIEAVPQLSIEKISKDNSLFLKIETFFSTISDSFIKENDLEKVILVNNLEKKLLICDVNYKTFEAVIDEIIKLLLKHQRNFSIRSGYYLDEGNLLIIQEDIAKEFITKDLFQLASKYRIVGSDKLKKYNIKFIKPKLVGKLSSSIDFLEGNLEVEIGNEKFSIMELLSKLKKDSYIVLGDGSSAIINKKYIEKLERVFDNTTSNNVKISFFDLPIIEDLINEKIFEDGHNPQRDFFEGINNISLNKNLPKINATLREYQKYGYHWISYLLENNLGACLADDMGLGKTLQAISVITNLHNKKLSEKTLIIMPKSLIFNWESEINKFSPKLKVGIYYGTNRDLDTFKNYEVILTTYGTIRNDIEILKDIKLDFVILDESQNIKNIYSQANKAIMLLNTRYRLALSGTPIENNLLELYSLFRFLNPTMFGSLDNFNKYYILPIQKDNDKVAMEELKKRIYPFILRRVKKEVLKDLPEKIEKTLFIEMNKEQKKFYEERRSYYYNLVHMNIKTQGINKSQFSILQALNELRQIASCPENKNPNIFSNKKIAVIENAIEAVENNHKVLIFANYLTSINSICNELESRGIKYLSMTGDTKDRHVLVDKFQSDPSYKVFVMTLKTGGVGLNLTAADTIFIYDPWWNKTVENQAIDRAYRLGQDNTVFAYKMILKDTIEEKILTLQKAKSLLIENLISDEGADFKFLSEEDIEFILGS